MPEITPFTNLDFFDIKNGLKIHLKSKEQFKDYDFEGSNLSVLLDILAYNTYQNNFISNMAISESFLDSAQLKNSVVSHAKELNYLPQSRSAARASFDVRLNPFDNPNTITIPRKNKFTARCGNKIFNFYTLETVSLSQIRGRYIYKNLQVNEGKFVTELFTVTSTSRFVLSNDHIDLSTIRISVRASVNSTTKIAYLKKSSLFGVKSSDPVFYVQPSFDDKYEITFGSNIFGIQPSVGSVIEIEYLTTNGEEANGITSFSSETISGYPVTITNISTSTGGAERETIQSIKFFAPKSIQLQERAVTEYDYEVILKNNFPEINSISAFGGDLILPPQYGRVIVSVDLNNHETITPYDIEKYRIFLKDRSPLAIEPIVKSAEYINLSILSKIKYDVSKTDSVVGDIKENVNITILNHGLIYLNSFGSNFYYSKLIGDIDKTESSIKSNETNVFPYYGFSPKVGISSTYYFNFSNRLESIFSSQFVFNGQQVFIKDDGLGSLNITNASNELNNVKLNIGSINYITGEVRVSNLHVDSYESTLIKLYAKTTNLDITAPPGKIILIKDDDISITVIGS